MSRDPEKCAPCDDDDDRDEWIAGIAVFLDILAIIPQIMHVYVKQSAKSLSYIWLFTSLFTNFLWLYFGYTKHLTPLVVSSVFFIFAFIVLGFMKVRYDR